VQLLRFALASKPPFGFHFAEFEFAFSFALTFCEQNSPGRSGTARSQIITIITTTTRPLLAERPPRLASRPAGRAATLAASRSS